MARPHGSRRLKVAVPLARGRSAQDRPGRGRARHAGRRERDVRPLSAGSQHSSGGGDRKRGERRDRWESACRLGTRRHRYTALPATHAAECRRRARMCPCHQCPLGLIAAVPSRVVGCRQYSWRFMASTSPQPTTQRCNHWADTLAERSNAFRAPERTDKILPFSSEMSREFIPFTEGPPVPRRSSQTCTVGPGLAMPEWRFRGAGLTSVVKVSRRPRSRGRPNN